MAHSGRSGFHTVGMARTSFAQGFPRRPGEQKGAPEQKLLKAAPSKLEAALEKGKGADYERIVSRIADGIVRERRASSEIVAQEWPDIRETIERVAEIDPELARNLTELSEGKVTLAPDALREYIREKVADATQATQFSDAFDAAIDEARQAGAAPPGATDEGLHGEASENAGPATSPSELSASRTGISPAEKLGVLPGFDAHIRAQREGAARVQGEQLTERMNRQPESIEPAAGEMERLSPLFRGTGASPQNEMFAAGQQNTPMAEQKPTIEAALEQHLHSMQGAEERWAQRREQGRNFQHGTVLCRALEIVADWFSRACREGG
ncbi:MAG TPA: hypothetical protein VFB23_11105 [Candidatus Acidoferrales bacterium]|nr:hypothetical protein [Candidatus Acidoferrales bacterium]